MADEKSQPTWGSMIGAVLGAVCLAFLVAFIGFMVGREQRPYGTYNITRNANGYYVIEVLNTGEDPYYVTRRMDKIISNLENSSRYIISSEPPPPEEIPSA